MTPVELSAQAANLQRSISSPTTCSSATVDSLKAVLLPEHSPLSQPRKPSAKSTSSLSTCTRKRSATKTPGPNIIEICKDVEQNQEAVNLEERLALATNVFNHVLKSLSNATRTFASRASFRPKRASLARCSSGSSSPSGQSPRSKTPLQPISANQNITPQRKKLGKTSSPEIHRDTDGLRAQARCAQVALASLRASHDLGKRQVNSPAFQVENGMSALINKLIALGFYDLALKEIRILKKRLQTASNTERATTKPITHALKQESKLLGPNVSKETVAELLNFRHIASRGPVLSLIITMQLQILKILAQTCIDEPELLLKLSDLDAPDSLVSLIQRQVDSAQTDTINKAARELEVLAQLILKICDKLTYTAKLSNVSLRDNSAVTILQMQTAALAVRARWWKLSGHNLDLAKDAFIPLSRFLDAFKTNTHSPKEEQYRAAQAAFKVVSVLIQDNDTCRDQAIASTYRLLADFAQAAGRAKEGSVWIQKAMSSCLDGNSTPLQRCTMVCQSIILRFRAEPSMLSSASSTTLLEHAADQLAESLHGEPAELDELLVTVTSLRKSLLSFILKEKYDTGAGKSCPSPKVIQTCLQLITLTVRFTFRYLGNRPSDTSNEKTIARYTHRARLVVAVALHMIESIATIARMYARSHVEDWTMIKPALNDCVDLVIHFKSLKDTNVSEQEDVVKLIALLPRLSSPYWYRYVDLSNDRSDIREQRQCLGSCIEILQICTPEEQNADSLSLKLEHYGRLYESAREDVAALKVYKDALQLHVGHGILAKAAEAASVRSLAYVFEEDEGARHLARTLEAYTRVSLRLRESNSEIATYYDSLELHNHHRALLLAYQFSALTCKPRSRNSSTIVFNTIRDLAKNLLELCSSFENPVLRLHAVSQMLYLRETSPDAVEESVLHPTLDEYTRQPMLSSHTQSGLHTYTSHLIHSLNLLVAIRKDPPEFKAIENSLRAWAEMLRDMADYSRLQTLVYDMKAWYLHLELIIEFLGFQDLHFLKCLALHVYTSACELSGSAGSSSLGLRLVQLGSQYVRLGYCGLGDMALRRADQYLGRIGESAGVRIYWHLANAEMALETQNKGSCNDHLRVVRASLNGTPHKESGRQKLIDRIQLYGLNADADMLQSKLAAAEGNLYGALLFARLGVRGFYRIWTMLERQRADSAAEYDHVRENNHSDSLTRDFSELKITDPVVARTPSSKHAALQNAAFWTLVPRIFNGLLVLCSGFSHAGLYSETRYYLDEARNITENLKNPVLLVRFLASQVFYSHLAGEVKKAKASFEQADEVIRGIQVYPDPLMRIQLMRLGIKINPDKSAQDALEKAKVTLQDMKRKDHITLMFHEPDALESAVGQRCHLSIPNQDASPQQQNQTRAAVLRCRPKVSRPRNEVPPLPTLSGDPVDVDVLALCRAEGEICHEQAFAVLALGELDKASALAVEAEAKPQSLQDKILQAGLLAEINLRKGIQELASHPMYNIVPESTISYPSICRSGKPLATIAVERRVHKQIRQPKESAKRTTEKINPEEIITGNTDFHLMRAGQHFIVGVLRLAQRVAATYSLHYLLDVLSRTLVILTALPTSSTSSSIPPISLIFASELGRMISTLQGALAICVEKRVLALADSLKANLVGVTGESESLGFLTQDLDLANFEADYIDILPKEWDVVSMTVSESEEEILISKMRLGEAPFVLRIPFNRQTGLDCDDVCFGFAEAKRELQDTIELANRSSQEANTQTQKIIKKEWWSTRNALDRRIQDLLINIESIWFGGFRGILSQHWATSNLLARFQKSLQDILDKHLPSRQKSGKGPQVERISLGSHVLELFVGLGPPSDFNDVDDQILDLTYFVVDILQFNGERNAYDEIDFDSIVVEILDALRQYHQVASGQSDDQGRHTILILDKKLHCFPWESMSCMKGQSISRLPSLSCLRQRILQQRKQQDGRPDIQRAADGLHVHRHDGAFILNPAGDLTNTQENFEDRLQGLSGWEGIVETRPQEADFKGYLENHDVFLYFGHGSGSQYIRSRTIKKLGQCAVSLLMGCSSGALTEAGKLEPYGPPIDYMHAGCPALLANLWDVTDKDIDRFAQSVLEKWGLFEKGQQPALRSSPVKKSARQKGKGKVKDAPRIDEGETKTPVSLDEAVAQSRDACILKYLNGAAPVIYGIPVFLD